MHLPCPQSFKNFELPNGLSLEVTKPLLGYHVEYESSSGACRFDLDFEAVMPPFDMHDPDQNPLYVEGDDWAEPHKAGLSSAKGHFDVLGRVTGEFELRGRRYEVDCVDGMDHSWGPRSEESAGTGLARRVVDRTSRSARTSGCISRCRSTSATARSSTTSCASAT